MQRGSARVLFAIARWGRVRGCDSRAASTKSDVHISCLVKSLKAIARHGRALIRSAYSTQCAPRSRKMPRVALFFAHIRGVSYACSGAKRSVSPKQIIRNTSEIISLTIRERERERERAVCLAERIADSDSFNNHLFINFRNSKLNNSPAPFAQLQTAPQRERAALFNESL